MTLPYHTMLFCQRLYLSVQGLGLKAITYGHMQLHVGKAAGRVFSLCVSYIGKPHPMADDQHVCSAPVHHKGGRTNQQSRPRKH